MSQTSIDHSFDKSIKPKKTTYTSSSCAPVVEEPKKVTLISFSLASDAPKKSPTFADTSGRENKKPTKINTRSHMMVDQAQEANIQVSFISLTTSKRLSLSMCDLSL